MAVTLATVHIRLTVGQNGNGCPAEPIEHRVTDSAICSKSVCVQFSSNANGAVKCVNRKCEQEVAQELNRRQPRANFSSGSMLPRSAKRNAAK